MTRFAYRLFCLCKNVQIREIPEEKLQEEAKSNDYLNQLKDQVNFLIDACHSYDRGSFVYAKQMSAILRTLLKDNPKNNQTVSLLASIGVKETLKFYNTSYSAKDPAVLLNLVGLLPQYKSNPEADQVPIYIPMLDDTNLIDVQWIDFDDWWESNVIVCKDTTNNFSLSRKKIILIYNNRFI